MAPRSSTLYPSYGETARSQLGDFLHSDISISTRHADAKGVSRWTHSSMNIAAISPAAAGSGESDASYPPEIAELSSLGGSAYGTMPVLRGENPALAPPQAGWVPPGRQSLWRAKMKNFEKEGQRPKQTAGQVEGERGPAAAASVSS